MSCILLDKNVPNKYFEILTNDTSEKVTQSYKGKEYSILGKIQQTVSLSYRITLIAKTIFTAGLIFIFDKNFKAECKNLWQEKRTLILYSSDLLSIFTYYRDVASKNFKNEAQKTIANYNAGFMYETGKGTSQSLSSAAICYEWAEKKLIGNQKTETQYKLSDIYGKIYAVEPNEVAFKKEMEWLEIAAKNGHAEAQFKLSQIYTDRIKVIRKEKKYTEIAETQQIADDYLKLAAENGHAEAQYKLGEKYLDAYKDKKEESYFKEAVKWLELAAKNNRVKACDILGFLYIFTPLTKPFHDSKKAFDWIKLAVEKGSKEARPILAVMYVQGIGVDKSEDKAIELLQPLAAEEDTSVEEMVKRIKETTLEDLPVLFN